MVADQFESQLLLVGMWVSKVGSSITLGNLAAEANVEEIESSDF